MSAIGGVGGGQPVDVNSIETTSPVAPEAAGSAAPSAGASAAPARPASAGEAVIDTVLRRREPRGFVGISGGVGTSLGGDVLGKVVVGRDGLVNHNVTVAAGYREGGVHVGAGYEADVRIGLENGKAVHFGAGAKVDVTVDPTNGDTTTTASGEVGIGFSAGAFRTGVNASAGVGVKNDEDGAKFASDARASAYLGFNF